MFVEGTEKSNLANDGTFFGKAGAVAEDEATGQSDGTSSKKKARQDRPRMVALLDPRIFVELFQVRRNVWLRNLESI